MGLIDDIFGAGATDFIKSTTQEAQSLIQTYQSVSSLFDSPDISQPAQPVYQQFFPSPAGVTIPTTTAPTTFPTPTITAPSPDLTPMLIIGGIVMAFVLLVR